MPATTTITAPAPAPDPQPTSSGYPNPYNLDPFFACVAWRESHDDPHAVNPSSGAGGLFQFLPSTWANIGGQGLPQDADPATQIAMAYHLRDIAGTSPWAGGNFPC
jgi:soluble lytic murein transglycosylase-like protein